MRLNPFSRLRRSSAPRSRRFRLIFVGVVAILALGVATAGVLALRQEPPPPVADGPTFTYAGTWDLLELQRQIDAGEVLAVTVAPGKSGRATTGDLVAKTTDGQVIKVSLAITPGEAADALATMGHGGLLTVEAREVLRTGSRDDGGFGGQEIVSLLFIILLVVLLVVLVARLTGFPGRRLRDTRARFNTVHPAAPGAAGAARPAGGPAVRLADAAGCDEAKFELTEAIEFLRHPERFRELGAHIPRGIMLYGPPGTGKTLLAKGVAAEAGVPFIYASGSEFVEKYVGVGARRIRDLFKQARRQGRAVIFFDEFDALGKSRGGQNSHEEREQTLNQLLVELDGFDTLEDVVVIAATNRLDTLDPAVLRPGRFTRKIHVGLPDVKGRREILAVHARNKPLDETADLDSIARKSYGFSGAQLADLLNEAAILAARSRSKVIGSDDLHGAWLKVAVGTSRRRSMDGRERSIIAAHEVGHAICGRVHGDRRKVEEISLFAHGEALGVTVSSQEDNDLPSESDLRARLIALMGGRAAEEILFHEVTSGASNDFEKANHIASMMVTRFGMGRDPDAGEGGISGRGSLSFLVARQGGGLPSDVQGAATRAIRALLDEAYALACDTIVENMDIVRRVAAYLVEHERVDGDTFEELVIGSLEVPTAGDEWRPEDARPREWGDIVPFRDRRRAAAAARPRSAPSADRPASGPAPTPMPVREGVPGAAAALGVAAAPAVDATGGLVAGIDDTPSLNAAPPASEPVGGTSGPAPAVRTGRRRAGSPASHQVRRLAASWLRAAESRVRPG
jgi:cell division protease FtsH